MLIRVFAIGLILTLVGILLVYFTIARTPDARSSNPFLLRGSPGPDFVVSKLLSPVLAISTNRIRDNSLYVNITCSDGVTVGKLNDNYCDCIASGEDEPNTGACSGFAKPASVLYECPPARVHYIPAMRKRKIPIYNSRIRDGICDCHDCSDEK